jgi:hypothetical protein
MGSLSLSASGFDAKAGDPLNQGECHALVGQIADEREGCAFIFQEGGPFPYDGVQGHRFGGCH